MNRRVVTTNLRPGRWTFIKIYENGEHVYSYVLKLNGLVK